MRRARPDLPVADGERLLAWAYAEFAGPGEPAGEDGPRTVVGGTRDALYLPQRLPWEQVNAADWDEESWTLRVSEVGRWGQARQVHELTVSEPDRLLQLVRERITASVVLQRHVPIDGTRGVRVVARRPPGRAASVAWFFEYDHGIEPSDPVVQQTAQEALAAAQDEVSAP